MERGPALLSTLVVQEYNISRAEYIYLRPGIICSPEFPCAQRDYRAPVLILNFELAPSLANAYLTSRHQLYSSLGIQCLQTVLFQSFVSSP